MKRCGFRVWIARVTSLAMIAALLVLPAGCGKSEASAPKREEEIAQEMGLEQPVTIVQDVSVSQDIVLTWFVAEEKPGLAIYRSQAGEDAAISMEILPAEDLQIPYDGIYTAVCTIDQQEYLVLMAHETKAKQVFFICGERDMHTVMLESDPFMTAIELASASQQINYQFFDANGNEL